MNDKKSWFILFIVLLVVVVAGMMIFGKGIRGTSTYDKSAGAIDKNLYQAVFLINNQVYFGKLVNENSQFPVLRDIYYLQVNQPIQPVQTPGQAAAAANPEINLVKLGGELHGPTDEMRINRDQILLIENLRADSNLVKAIENYQASQAAAQ